MVTARPGCGHASSISGCRIARLRYRLYKIRELTDHDPADPENPFALQLATRSWQCQPNNKPSTDQT
jgi:hypothetical protein